jgi:hypothetical protein
MVQGYFSLQEAAQFLDMNPEELKQMAQRKEVRSFQDRGTLRFRVQDVQELGRRRGTSSSDPDLILGEAQPPTPRVGPKSPTGPRTPPKQDVPPGDDVFDFSLSTDDGVDIGKEILADLPPGSRKSGPKPHSSSQGRKSAVRSPQPQAGSTSDVKLVAEGAKPGSDSDVRLTGHHSDVQLEGAMAKTPKVARKPAMTPGSPTPKKAPGQSGASPDSASKKHPGRPAVQPPDSGVRLVPLDSDSDVKIVGAGSDEVALGAAPPPSASDSDIRLDKHIGPPKDSGEGELELTEEINLDEELRKQDAALKPPQGKVKPKSKVKLPTTSPFELSDSDVSHHPVAGAKSGAKPKSGPKLQSPSDSSDFDLTPSGGSGQLHPDSSDDFSLGLPDDSALGGELSGLSGPSSGISLNNPVDAGISLEEGNAANDIDFDLSLEVEATPKPAAMNPADSDSEFELSLDADDSGPQPAAPGPMDSDSEFELTLDDSGGLAPLEADDAHAPQLKADSAEKDIFETDFEVPALEDDSGSQVAALDTDLDSSDFDIALDDSAVEDESASQVVALDEEADEAAATRADEEGVEVDEAEFGALEAEADEEAEALADIDDAKTVVREKLVQPAPWGALPVVFMLPCVIVMVVVGLLGFELVQSAGGYKSPGFLTKAISEMIGKPIR